MLKLIQKIQTPPDKYRWKCRETGKTISCYSHDSWIRKIKEHCEFNGITPPSEQEAEDQLCKLLPPGSCVQENGEQPPWFLETRIGMQDVVRGTRVFAALGVAALQDKAVLVPKAKAMERSRICAGCPFAVSAEGCGSCHGISNLVAEIIGSVELDTDPMLANKMCAVCKCAARAQAWIPVEHLELGVTDLMMDQFPEWCWKKQEILEFRQSKLD